MHLDRKMSLWTPSLSSLFLSVLVLTIVEMQSGCNAASAAAKRPPSSPKIHSVKEMRIMVAHITQRLQKAEKGLAPLKSIQSDLDRKFNSYSARTAHHEWQSANQQESIATDIRQEAHQLKAQINEIDQALKTQFGTKLRMLQSPSLRRFARDGPTKTQLAQSAKIYKRILELLQNMIECPVHILQFLGEESAGSEGDDYMPSENSEPVYGEEEPETGYGYQYYN